MHLLEPQLVQELRQLLTVLYMELVEQALPILRLRVIIPYRDSRVTKALYHVAVN